MKSRTPVEGSLYTLVSEGKKGILPAIYLETTVVHMLSTITRQQLTIDNGHRVELETSEGKSIQWSEDGI